MTYARDENNGHFCVCQSFESTWLDSGTEIITSTGFTSFHVSQRGGTGASGTAKTLAEAKTTAEEEARRLNAVYVALSDTGDRS
jgi:hypothetical protein